MLVCARGPVCSAPVKDKKKAKSAKSGAAAPVRHKEAGDTADAGPARHLLERARLRAKRVVPPPVEALPALVTVPVPEKGGGRGRGAKKSGAYDAYTAYGERFTAALQYELEEEEAALDAQRLWPRERLEAEGEAIFGLEATPDGMLYRVPLIRLLQPGRLLPFHAFRQGDSVLLSRNGPDEGDPTEAVIVDRSRRWLRVGCADLAAAEALVAGPGGPWRLDRAANAVTHERLVAGVAAFTDGMRGRAVAGQEADHKSKKDDGGKGDKLGLRPIGLILLDSAKLVAGAAASPPSGATGSRGGGGTPDARPVAAVDGMAALNRSQREAVSSALSRTLTLIQGPPGTGKTKTLVALLTRAIAGGALPPGSRALACADSNGALSTVASRVHPYLFPSAVAADNLLAGCLSAGLATTRIGQPAKVSPALRGATLEARALATPAGARAAELLERARTAAKPEPAGALVAQAREAQSLAEAQVLAATAVIVSTCAGAADPVLGDTRFALVVVDEATQATEPAALLPLLRAARSAVLVGDPQQLPPTVVSADAVAAGLPLSLFERLVGNGLESHLLDTQYRMHPAIAAFPSASFYGGRLISHPTPASRPPPAGFDWPDPAFPIAFVTVPGEEALSGADGQGTSRLNREEAVMVARIVTGLVAANPKGTLSIGVVTPYAGQARLLSDTLGDLLTAGGPDASGEGESPSDVEVKTVDGFQGAEREVIVLSTVRSNADGRLGFLADARRANVALTRAKRGVIVVGSAATLTAHAGVWRDWLSWLERKWV